MLDVLDLDEVAEDLDQAAVRVLEVDEEVVAGAVTARPPHEPVPTARETVGQLLDMGE